MTPPLAPSSRSYAALAATMALTASASSCVSAFTVGWQQYRKSPLSNKPTGYRSAEGSAAAAPPLTVLHAKSKTSKTSAKTSKSKTSKSKTSKSKTSKSKTSKSKTSKSKTSKSETSKAKKSKSKTKKQSETKAKAKPAAAKAADEETATEITAAATLSTGPRVGDSTATKSGPGSATEAAAIEGSPPEADVAPASSANDENANDDDDAEEVSPGVETLREYLKYSDYGIRKAQDQRRRGEAILQSIESGDRPMPNWYYEDFVEEATDEVEDPNVIVAEDWGTWDERDLAGPPMEGDWDEAAGDPNPNLLDAEFEYVTEIPKDDDGVEKGYDPIFGSWYPVDERTIINPSESYIIDEKTANATSVPKLFPKDDDPEIEYNADVKQFRKSLKIVETYVDEWTGLDHPRYVATWHGNPIVEKYPQRDFTNNRFTKDEDRTNFDELSPYRARKRAVELARSKNNEWLPRGKSAEYHDGKTKIYTDRGVLAGSFLVGEKDPEIVAQIQPALDVLGDCAELLSIQRFGGDDKNGGDAVEDEDEGGGTATATTATSTTGMVFRFHYHGLIKNKRGMAAWTETLIKDCGVECTGVVFETGWRKRDPFYDHGDHWYGPY